MDPVVASITAVGPDLITGLGVLAAMGVAVASTRWLWRTAVHVFQQHVLHYG